VDQAAAVVNVAGVAVKPGAEKVTLGSIRYAVVKSKLASIAVPATT
jgi:hypothetical protein